MLKLAGLDGVKTELTAALGAADTWLMAASAQSPWITPPDPLGDYHYYLTLIDAETPTKWERVKVTARNGAGPYQLTIERNIASSSGGAQAFAQGALLQWSPGAKEIDRWRMILSASMTGTNALTGTRFLAPFSGSTTGSIGAAFWVNRTGKTLRLSKLVAVLSTSSTFSGDSIVVSVETGSTAPSSPSALQAAVSPGNYGFNTDGGYVLDVAPDGLVCFMLSRANSGATVSGAFQLAHVSVLAEEL